MPSFEKKNTFITKIVHSQLKYAYNVCICSKINLNEKYFYLKGHHFVKILAQSDTH